MDSDQLKSIRDSLKSEGNPILFSESELCNEIKNIISKYLCDGVSTEDIFLLLSGYLRKSAKDKKYYFNTDRRRNNDNYKNLIDSLYSIPDNGKHVSDVKTQSNVVSNIYSRVGNIIVIDDSLDAKAKSGKGFKSTKATLVKGLKPAKKSVIKIDISSVDSTTKTDNTDKIDASSNVNKKSELCVDTLKSVITVTSKKLDKNEPNNINKDNKKDDKKDDKIDDDLDSDSDDSEIDTEEWKEMERKFMQSYKNKQKKNNDIYKFPVEEKYDVVKRTGAEYGPFGTQWVHDKQKNDEYDTVLKKRAIKYDKLRAIILPPQRSPEWFATRRCRVTASDGGTVLGKSKYNAKYTFILKKVLEPKFQSNVHCYHGKKHEMTATMIYEYRMNIKVEEFGLIVHPTILYLAASPDGISPRYKLDGIHRSKYVGRMLEIKVPSLRKIKMSGPIKDHICPIHYWIQVQLQLECCDLEECDFWQCKITEYENRAEFIDDTDSDEPFRSLKSGFEKGCLIQLMPRKRAYEWIYEDKDEDGCETYWNEKKYLDAVYADAQFIYPPKIEMTPYECDLWIAKTMAELQILTKKDTVIRDGREEKNDIKDYVFDKVIYWNLVESKNVTIKRDRIWFKEKLPEFKKMWDYVIFFRENPDKTEILTEYINSMPIKYNKKIMKIIEELYVEGPNNSKRAKELRRQAKIEAKLKAKLKAKKMRLRKNSPKYKIMYGGEYMF
uniref:YqaJ-like recombinase domain protein n=1 Tax=Mimivirus LCMiAC01 TaxID=2506608 RepID=A0A481YZ95_9VIRU|nr:MAG: YqaJ-like recombinase domain protein [Mimivirus LCMiAC01]